MSAASDYLEVEFRKHVFRSGSFTKPTVLAIALCTSPPVDADTGALTGKEVANANGYARATLNPGDANWSAVSSTDGNTDNLVAIVFAQATGSWGTITHYAICDSATYGAGNMLIYGALTTPKTIGNLDIVQFNVGGLDVTFA